MNKPVALPPLKAHNKKSPQQNNQVKSILTKKQTGGVKVIVDGEDLTPEALNPLLNEGAKGKEIKGNLRKLEQKSITADCKIFTQSTSRFHTELHKQQLYSDTVFRQSYNAASFIDEVAIEPEKYITLSLESSTVKDEEEPVTELAPERTVSTPMPSHISLILKETPTFFLLELPSKTVDKNSDEATEVEASNARYEYLTEGKGRIRKVVNAEVQTVQILLKTRTTEAEEVKRKHNHAFASEWDMYDTHKAIDDVKSQIKVPEFFGDEDEFNKIAEKDDESFSNEEQQMLKLLKNLSFQEALCVTERLLANNNFNTQQKRFRGLSNPDPHREDIQYKYRLNLLWTFANKETSGKCVTALCWNDDNNDILAVAYGKFLYTERTTGMVMLWNIKNPVQPERTYRFEQPVTAINFSKHNPNLLGIGFYDGTVEIVDVSVRELRLVGSSSKDSPSFEPIWQIVWYQGSDYFKGAEQIITAGQDGRISFFRNQDTLELIYEQIMRISRPEGKLKGVETVRRCHVPGIPVNRYAAALVLCQHPIDGNIYYVGTNEGTIHKCSRNYHYQHLDLFLAHQGPLYEIKFSPFCNKVFMTCGDDWQVRIWADGITEPLFELTKELQSIQSADWSPTHSTVIANICGTSIYVWDIQRKVYNPQSITLSPTSCRNTVIRFSKCGRCLVVGDIEGNVHVFALEDMPFPAFFQDDLLYNAIIRCLITRPDLIRQIQKMGKLNFNKADFEK